MKQALALLLTSTLTLAVSPAPAGNCLPPQPDVPRTLVLALDGVPWRAIVEAREQGAFDDWPEPVPLVSTFPSLTNVCFTAIFDRFEVERTPGYEVKHFDVEQNRLVGGSVRGYSERLSAWRNLFDVTSRSVGSKISAYTGSRRKAWKDFERAEATMLDSTRELVTAHIGATDAMMHLRGDKAIQRFLSELDERLTLLIQRHTETTGRGLRIVLLSDHGNGNRKIRSVHGLRRELRRVGLSVKKRIEQPGDVVAATFGLVSFGALFLHDALAERAARAAVRNEAVELAVWRMADQELRVVSSEGSASVRWKETDQGLRLAYSARTADPLGLEAAFSELPLDNEGFATASDWLGATALLPYPNAPQRLVHAVTHVYVHNGATVLLSLKPGYAWGWKAGHFASRFNGGRLEGTHGGLDLESSLGFMISSDSKLQPDSVVAAHEALGALAGLKDCLGHRE